MTRKLRADGQPRGSPKCPVNPAEKRCWEELVKLGWEPTKRGWPDFVAFKGERICVVEVKPRTTEFLKRSQIRVMNALSAAGIECFKFTPDFGFTRWRSK